MEALNKQLNNKTAGSVGRMSDEEGDLRATIVIARYNYNRAMYLGLTTDQSPTGWYWPSRRDINDLAVGLLDRPPVQDLIIPPELPTGEGSPTFGLAFHMEQEARADSLLADKPGQDDEDARDEALLSFVQQQRARECNVSPPALPRPPALCKHHTHAHDRPQLVLPLSQNSYAEITACSVLGGRYEACVFCSFNPPPSNCMLGTLR